MKTLHGGRLPAHEFVDHPSEIVLRVRAETFAALAEEAVMALASIMESGTRYTGESQRTAFVVDGIDRGAILVNLMNEVVSRAEADRFIPSAVTASLTSASSLRVSIRGKSVAGAPSLVKAATFHNLNVSDRDGVVEASVTLDI